MTNTVRMGGSSAEGTYTVEDVEYRHDGRRSWLARLYRPHGDGPFPALLNVHGGAWNLNDRTTNPALAEGLAARGVVVASIDFRMGGDHPYPSSLEDVNFAVRWLKAHAAGFGADPATVGGLGSSSGGHLILLSAMRPHDPRYTMLPLPGGEALDATLCYVVSCWGVLDPYGRYLMAQRTGRSELVEYHDRYFRSEAAMQEASPLLLLARGEPAELPPLLLAQGTLDVNIPPGMIEEMADRYRAAGGDAELALYPDMPHGIAGWPAPEAARLIGQVRGFIARRTIAPVVAG